jgi:hypothetical protein
VKTNTLSRCQCRKCLCFIVFYFCMWSHFFDLTSNWNGVCPPKKPLSLSAATIWNVDSTFSLLANSVYILKKNQAKKMQSSQGPSTRAPPCWSSCSLEGATPDQQHAIAWRIGEKKVLIWSWKKETLTQKHCNWYGWLNSRKQTYFHWSLFLHVK